MNLEDRLDSLDVALSKLKHRSSYEREVIVNTGIHRRDLARCFASNHIALLQGMFVVVILIRT